MAKIDSYEWYLKNTLKEEFYYQIPIYQRPYQWTEENCEKLLDDLFEDYEEDRESDYFCGSLVLVKSDPNSKTETYDVVDGQQRLSTFILLAKVLADLYNDCLDPKNLEHLQEGWKDRHTERKRLSFNTIGSNAEYDFQDALDFFDDPHHVSKNDENNYLKNAVCLKDYLRKKEIKNINDFIDWLYSNVKFITIICPSIDKALRIFNVLNARGLPLNATDIFKGELLKELAKKEEDQKKLVSRWNALSQKCSDNDLTMETLFSWYLTYLESKTSREKMEKRLVTWFNTLNKPPLEYLKGVEDFYNAYCEVLEMQDRHAHLLSYKDDDYLHVILCTSILHHYSDQDIEALKELLVKFYYQDWVAGQTKSTRSQTCCNIIIALKEKKSVENIASIVVKKYLDDKNITQHFKENLQDSNLYTKFYFAGKSVKKNSWLKPILILVEYFISDDPRPKRIEKNDFHVEHILPQKPDPSSQWVKDFSEEERKLYTHSLANLTLLGGTKNSQASNKDFEEKKEIYKGNAVKLGKKKPFRVMTCYKMTIDIAHKYKEWKPENLEKRKEELIKCIEGVLTL
ncbi:DUF262 domain-containing protein [Helicobacter pylori]|uniref:DUF262 domain-containing protein n=1 Tax=Helicobacter pylori TaxID=210 RepID=UPI000FDD8FCC|nr:DUF262 domain-containing protein [Helicobacter pylori]RVZ23554.1 DUF262 domain-containing protein [Helicobacter pylori]